MLRLLTLLTPALLTVSSSATDPDENWLAGWNDRVKGEIIAYQSADPEATRALLVRSEAKERSIAWMTEPVPADQEGDWASFVWLFGLDVNPERREWKLLIDGEEWLKITNPPSNEARDWSVTGREGAELRFRGTFFDRYDDLFGYAMLRLPRRAWTPGEPVQIEVVGESAQSRVWYMTFMSPVAPRVTLTPRSALLRGDVPERGASVSPIDFSIWQDFSSREIQQEL